MLCVLLAHLVADLDYNKGYALCVAVERCDIVFIGRVKNIDYVFRRNTKVGYTTDITVGVTKLIKGTLNIDPRTVKFMIEGGEWIHPDTGEDLRLDLSDTVKYEIGAERLFFLARSTDAYHANFAYDRLIEYRGEWGTQKLIEDSVAIGFSLNCPIASTLL